jgi:hypothetical protein
MWYFEFTMTTSTWLRPPFTAGTKHEAVAATNTAHGARYIVIVSCCSLATRDQRSIRFQLPVNSRIKIGDWELDGCTCLSQSVDRRASVSASRQRGTNTANPACMMNTQGFKRSCLDGCTRIGSTVQVQSVTKLKLIRTPTN